MSIYFEGNSNEKGMVVSLGLCCVGGGDGL